MCKGPLRTQCTSTKWQTQLTGPISFNGRLFIKKDIISYDEVLSLFKNFVIDKAVKQAYIYKSVT